jgi:hypothetical protein
VPIFTLGVKHQVSSVTVCCTSGDQTLDLVKLKLFSHFRIPRGTSTQQPELLYIGLYLLIWGEASNVRLMPECLCYIFHHVSALFVKCYFVFVSDNVYFYFLHRLYFRKILLPIPFCTCSLHGLLYCEVLPF